MVKASVRFISQNMIIYIILVTLLYIRSKWPSGLRRLVCSRSHSEIVCSNPAGGMFFLNVVFYQVDVSATS